MTDKESEALDNEGDYDEQVEPDEKGFVPPYISFSSFLTFMDKMKEHAPRRIDRSILVNMSGSQQTQMLQALRAFGLIGEQGRVEPAFDKFAKAEKHERAQILGDLLRTNYSRLVELADEKATQSQMEEWFKTFRFSRRTMAKAVSFYLNAAKYAEVPTSPFFGPVKGLAQASKPRVRKQSPLAPGEQPPPPPGSQKATPKTGDSYAVELSSGGEVELRVNVSLFGLSEGDLRFVMDLVNKVRDYEKEVGPDVRVQTDDQPAS